MIVADENTYRKLYRELGGTWQIRLLRNTEHRLHRVVQSVLAESWPDAIGTALKIAFPGFTSIKLPFFVTAGRIDEQGRIVADMALTTGVIKKDYVIYGSELELQSDFRRAADRLKLSDEERMELFAAVRKWITADRRAPVEGEELTRMLN